MNPPNGWSGVIEHGGGTMEIYPWEGIVFENSGIYVHHNNKYETVTFLPIFTVRMVRWHDAAKEKEGRDIAGEIVMKHYPQEQKMIGTNEGKSQ